jgi:hypothetical protein
MLEEPIEDQIVLSKLIGEVEPKTERTKMSPKVRKSNGA